MAEQILWNTSEMIALLSSIEGVRSVKSDGQGGDVDTDNLVLKIKGSKDSLHVAGFVIGNADISTPENALIDMVELCDGLDSSGGLSSESLETSLAYARVASALRQRGFDVVDRMKDYF